MPVTSHPSRRGLLALPLVLAGCAAPGSRLPPLPPAAVTEYRLGAEDQVRITVFNDARLSGDFRVSDSGTIALPLVGLVLAAHRSTTQLARAIEEELRQRSLFTEPNVAVQVLTYRPIFVIGLVEKGGQFPYQPGMTALTAVAIAGGFNYRAIKDYVSITRVGAGGQPGEFRAAREALVLPGDVVTVFERQF